MNKKIRNVQGWHLIELDLHLLVFAEYPQFLSRRIQVMLILQANCPTATTRRTSPELLSVIDDIGNSKVIHIRGGNNCGDVTVRPSPLRECLAYLYTSEITD